MEQYVLPIKRDISIDELLIIFTDIDQRYDILGDNLLIVDFTDCYYISPSSLTILASYLKLKQYYSFCLQIDYIEPKSKNIDTYISRMDFYSILGITKPEYFYRHSEKGRFLPINNIIDQINYQIIDDVMEILSNNCELYKELYYAIDWAFNELLDNIIEHADSRTGGFMIGQSKRDEIEFCIADNGIGIPNSLRMNKDYINLEDSECMMKSLEKGGTDGKGQGNGLYITKRFVELNGGQIHIYSNDNLIIIRDGIISYKKVLNSWDGTIIILRINKHQNINLFEMFETDDIGGLPSGYVDSLDIDEMLW